MPSWLDKERGGGGGRDTEGGNGRPGGGTCDAVNSEPAALAEGGNGRPGGPATGTLDIDGEDAAESGGGGGNDRPGGGVGGLGVEDGTIAPALATGATDATLGAALFAVIAPSTVASVTCGASRATNSDSKVERCVPEGVGDTGSACMGVASPWFLAKKPASRKSIAAPCCPRPAGPPEAAL